MLSARGRRRPQAPTLRFFGCANARKGDYKSSSLYSQSIDGPGGAMGIVFLFWRRGLFFARKLACASRGPVGRLWGRLFVRWRVRCGSGLTLALAPTTTKKAQRNGRSRLSLRGFARVRGCVRACVHMGDDSPVCLSVVRPLAPPNRAASMPPSDHAVCGALAIATRCRRL